MPIVFANPLGFLALLGIPAILLIHLLQRQPQKFPISTLFMLDAIDRQSLKGRKLERLRSSVPLWLQLLSVLVLTWLLIQPRWTRENQVQQIVIVIDSSASMEPFKENAAEQLKTELSRIPGQLTTVVYTLMESHEQGDRLYRGGSVSEMTDSLKEWGPANSAHSPEASLRVGRSIAGPAGNLIFLTDHLEDQLPFGASLLSVGEPISNVGFAGLRIEPTEESEEELSWQATVRNYSDEPQTREWFLSVGQQRTETRSMSLKARETRTLSGKFPEDTGRATLNMAPDDFARDDLLYMVAPQLKPVYIATNVAPDASEMVQTIIESLDNAPLLRPPAEGSESVSPDLLIATYNPLQPRPLPPVGIVLLDQQYAPKEFFQGTIVAANHPFVQNLNWQGLIAKSTASVPLKGDDVPLLWQGDRTLVLLRKSSEVNQLIFNFDVGQSNAQRLPSFVIMINRFVNQLRYEKVAQERKNLELNQQIQVAVKTGDDALDILIDSSGTRQTVPKNLAGMLRAPRDPGFFAIAQGDVPLLDASANFADTREADFSEAASLSDLNVLSKEIMEKQSVNDPMWQAWTILILLILLLCWYLLNPPSREVPISHPTT